MSDRVQERLLRHTIYFLKARQAAGKTLLLGLSGGLDSSVLLHLLAEATKSISFTLHALHAHHGLSPNADAWAQFCQQQCDRLDIPLAIHHVQVPADSGLGIEAAARELRYEKLFAAPADWIVLAHHQDDQVETLLLQMLRGAGVKGMSAMAATQENRRLLRPLLDVSRAELESYAIEAAVPWVDDESNLNTAYDRNFCRHQVLPLLETRFPAVQVALARSAHHMAEAANLLDQLAALDAGCAINQGALSLAVLSRLDDARQRNLMRWWLSSWLRYPPSSKRLQEIIKQLCQARDDAEVAIQLDANLVVRRYQGKGYIVQTVAVEQGEWDWHGEPVLNLPHGVLKFSQVKGTGVAFQRLGIERLQVKFRAGGEHFKPAANRPRRSLKYLFQEVGIPPWERDTFPLLYWHDELAIIPGIGTASHLQAQGDELGLVVNWVSSET